MQKLVFTFTLLVTSLAAAQTCRDISGLYQMAEGAVVQYHVEDCTRLIRWSGFTTKKGEIIMSPEKQVYLLSGTPECNTLGKCQSVTSVSDGILISLNYKGYVKTKEHGLCQYQSTLLSVDAHRDLKSEYQVENCDDGFTGVHSKLFPKVIIQN
ncbi:hypothetical protein [Bdellovibrio sp. HCB274]|uniref:hypothetical protein n=1 Tax=Bdellovibrio sp. HCB274 TaxID=3394361 RepID=UPI0039B3CFA4